MIKQALLLHVLITLRVTTSLLNLAGQGNECCILSIVHMLINIVPAHEFNDLWGTTVVFINGIVIHA